MNPLRILLIAIGIIGIIDTLLISFISNLNIGVLLPGLLGLPLLLLGLFFPQLLLAAPKFALFIKWAALCGYTLLILAFWITWAKIDRAASLPAPQHLDAVIVLGAGLRGERPSLILTRRMDVAISYLQTHPGCMAILSGGKGSDEHISEAEAMSRYFLVHGIPQNRFILEDQSTNTRENFVFSKGIIDDTFGPSAQIGFVTTTFHVFRASRVALNFGIQAHGMSAPDIWYLTLNNHLRECVAIWAYALTGRI